MNKKETEETETNFQWNHMISSHNVWTFTVAFSLYHLDFQLDATDEQKTYFRTVLISSVFSFIFYVVSLTFMLI